jgi:hypothetical protein
MELSRRDAWKSDYGKWLSSQSWQSGIKPEYESGTEVKLYHMFQVNMCEYNIPRNISLAIKRWSFSLIQNYRIFR